MSVFVIRLCAPWGQEQDLFLLFIVWLAPSEVFVTHIIIW